jgi:predicted O-methyltransferase YrrM
MSATRAAYEANRAVWSDIQSHLPRLFDLVIDNAATRVLELGVRSGVSTTAFLAALENNGGHLWSVDLAPPPHLEGPWTFVLGKSIDVAAVQASAGTDPFDIVFVDTDHTYELTRAEIEAWAPHLKPGGRMVFHDTNLERFDHHTTPQPAFPVRTAIEEWLNNDALAVLEAFYPDSYGLTIVRVP